ncbi:Prokaryotic ubiquitin-like protein Pup, partial [Arthrobacter sp. DR-2P]
WQARSSSSRSHATARSKRTFPRRLPHRLRRRPRHQRKAWTTSSTRSTASSNPMRKNLSGRSSKRAVS